MAAFNTKIFRPIPPDKGSFPLDHDGECRLPMVEYLECLHKNDKNSSLCREFCQKYLKCRMDTQLMAKEDWDKLGFKNNKTSSDNNNVVTDSSSKIK